MNKLSVQSWIRENLRYQESKEESKFSDLIDSEFNGSFEIDSITMQSRESDSSISSKTGFASLPIDSVFKYACGLDYQSFLYSQLESAEDLIDKLEDAPQDLKKKVFSALNQIMENGYPLPCVETKERIIEFYVNAIVLQFFGHNLKTGKRTLSISAEQYKMDAQEFKSFNEFAKINEPAILPSGQSDLCVLDKDNGKVIAIIEVKRIGIDSGFKQLILYMKMAFIRNNDGQPLFGVLTNGLDVSFLKLDKNGFKALYKMNFIVPFIKNPMYEEKWIKYDSKAIDILFNILK